MKMIVRAFIIKFPSETKKSLALAWMKNLDDRFNPLNTSSPYYDSTNNVSKIVPFRQVRIQATYDSTTYNLFRGL